MSTEQIFKLVKANPNSDFKSISDKISDSETTKWSHKDHRLYQFLNELTAAKRISFVDGKYI